MRAIILAAGRGSRMGPITDNKPKCMTELNGKPLINWQLDALHEAGITEVGVVTGYLKQKLSHLRLTEFHNKDWSTTQMPISLACANKWLLDGPCLVSYSDIIYEPDLISILIKANNTLTISYDRNWKKLWEKRFEYPLTDAESFKIDADGKVLEIGNSVSSFKEIDGQYMGLLKFLPAGWEEFKRVQMTLSKKEKNTVHMTTMLQKIIDNGKINVMGVPYQGSWAEIDCYSDLRIASEIFTDNLIK